MSMTAAALAPRALPLAKPAARSRQRARAPDARPWLGAIFLPAMASRRPYRHEILALARLAAPLAAASAGQSLMGLVDAAVVGRAGPAALAGIGLGNSLFFSLAAFGIGVMLGLDPLTAQALGAGDRTRARRLVWQGLWMALACGLALMVPLALLPLAAAPLGIDAGTAREGTRYVLARLPGVPALLFFFAARSYLQSLGATRPLLLAVVAANAVNLGLDLLLVFGGAGLPALPWPLRAVPAMGAMGAGLATTAVSWLQAGVLAWAIALTPAPRLSRRDRAPSRRDIALAARVGVPVGLHMGAEVGVFALVGFLAGRLGTEQLAAHQIAIALASFTFTAAVGIGQAGSVRVGWAVGAGDTGGARCAGLTAFAVGAGFMACAALAFVLFPGQLARAMSGDDGVVTAATPLLVVAAVFQISDATQAVGAGVLRGAGDTRFTFGANMVGHWLIGLPVAVGLGFALRLGVTGLWWGLCAGLSAVAAALLARFLWISSREIAPLVDAAPHEPCASTEA
jgi:MATE family multidrug resistance protein